jgi:hypothetical protein
MSRSAGPGHTRLPYSDCGAAGLDSIAEGPLKKDIKDIS